MLVHSLEPIRVVTVPGKPPGTFQSDFCFCLSETGKAHARNGSFLRAAVFFTGMGGEVAFVLEAIEARSLDGNLTRPADGIHHDAVAVL